MPLLRFLADSAMAFGSAGRVGVSGEPRFPVGPGNIEPIILDYSGWLGLNQSVVSSEWVTDLTTAGSENTGKVCSIRATIPQVASTVPIDTLPLEYAVTHTATATDGRKRVTTLYLVA